MKKFLLIAVLALMGCMDRPDKPTPPPAPPKPPRNPVICTGEVREKSPYTLAVKCDDGRTVEFTAYKYSLTRKESGK